MRVRTCSCRSSISMYVGMFTTICTSVCMSICLYVCMDRSMYVSMSACFSSSRNVWMYVCMCMRFQPWGKAKGPEAPAGFQSSLKRFRGARGSFRVGTNATTNTFQRLEFLFNFCQNASTNLHAFLVQNPSIGHAGLGPNESPHEPRGTYKHGFYVCIGVYTYTYTSVCVYACKKLQVLGGHWKWEACRGACDAQIGPYLDLIPRPYRAQVGAL